MQLLFASSNSHKLAEVREILAPHGIDVIGLDAVPELAEAPEPVEDGRTFEANARIKAVHYARAAGRQCLADDSGLVVDVLNGRPGVHSARYAGTRGSREQRDRDNNARLLRELMRVPHAKRKARFVCAMCLADEHGEIVAESRGTFEGIVADAPRGRNGFGYDPLLYLPDVGCTAAELSPQAKNARSHRGAAARAMARRLREARG